MSKEKIFLSSLTASEKFGNSILNGSIVVDELIELLNSEKVQKYVYEYKGKQRLNIQVIEWRKEDKHGRSHSLEVNTFIPDSRKADNDNDPNTEASEETSSENQASSENQTENTQAETETAKDTPENTSDSEKGKTTTKKTSSRNKRGSKTQAKEPVTA
ncbi:MULTISPECIES: hypothetical protein [Aquimarina]|uniref:Uncharacterized protein n=1 Tax=Aquimarina algiphila TaxID=2047982 RepID=A0A554VCG5_9FLAO|nr:MULTISPECIES: hypothetical protein [Aquimarina]TSE04397.1 hypothetical protein FOF46_26590 [Aquimarina algiphila]